MSETTETFELRSDLALRAYAHVFWAIDRALGDTLDGDAISIPAGLDWYVAHVDRQLDGGYLPTLVAEVEALALPGLSLASCRRLAPADAGALASATTLELVDLFNTATNDQSVAQLDELAQLRILNLAGTAISDASLAKIAALPSLEVLHLGWTQISDAGLATLTQARKLHTLDLRGTAIGDAGMAALARMPALRALGLQELAVSDAGVSALTPLAERLEVLDLGYTKIGAASVAKLASLERLHTLSLRATQLGEEHDEALVAGLEALTPGHRNPRGELRGLIR